MNKERTESLSRGLIVTLGKIYRQKSIGSVFHLRKLGLDFSEITNAQKLSFWRFISKTDQSGYWRLLPLAQEFFNGKAVPKRLKLVDGKVVGTEFETVDINYFLDKKNVVPFWNEKAFYAKGKSRNVVEQFELFG